MINNIYGAKILTPSANESLWEKSRAQTLDYESVFFSPHDGKLLVMLDDEIVGELEKDVIVRLQQTEKPLESTQLLTVRTYSKQGKAIVVADLAI